MGNRTTTQKPPERQTEQTEQSQHLNTIFQTLKELPTSFRQSQCVVHRHEILICGGRYQRACYSYHTLKNEYMFICEYPSDIILDGYCVVKLEDNNNNNRNEITLLSFGGVYNHTSVMKYVSVWDNISKKLNKFNNYNKWTPFTDNQNNPIIIGKNNSYYWGVRAVIGGSNNHLLFITCRKNNISVFDLNTFQFIKYDILPTDYYIEYHCFVLKSKNGQGQEMMKINQQNYQMLLFYKNTGLSIEYNENDNTFQFHKLTVCDDFKSLIAYAYVCINDDILFFGGSNDKNVVSKSVYKYSIREKKWMIFENTLPSPLKDCTAILNKEDDHIYIIGGLDDKNKTISVHMRTKVCVWDVSQLVIIIHYWIRTLKIKLGWIDDFDKIVVMYSINEI
ncbi:hypothetical protein RFI_04428 [Reticulomyxa filosa]|uniref:Kelch motif family protein n=1 Tax=Reticulomyxa filosa TaxID=46433 RepID=X6P3I4_RETFI|nr:hypothetical protein RFI_04428 [Reticulomyxa filosa]|eukprot:ETO32688.1 hypothetical protein RFI_04428 [Reticulomyxa filosa]